MPKEILPPTTALYPIPSVMASCGDIDGASNIITLAWAGTVASDPPMIAIGVRPDRFSYNLIKQSGEFVINLPDKEHVYAMDLCGVVSGRDGDKFVRAGLSRERAHKLKAPLIRECPVNIECVVRHVYRAGSHDVFLGEVVAVHVDRERSENGFVRPDEAVCYHARNYWSLGKPLGSHGYSLRDKE